MDNLQTIKSTTLHSLQQLPENLRSLLTRSIAKPAGGLPRITTAASIGAAAAAGAVAGASVHGVGGNLPHSPGAVAAAAATSALLASRRTTTGSTPTKGPQLLAATLSPRQPSAEAVGALGPGSSAPALVGGASAGGLAALLSHDKPPVPRRTSSSRSLRAKMADIRRQGSEALRMPLLESEQEGEGAGSPWHAAERAEQAQHDEQQADALEALLRARQEEQIRRMLTPPHGAAGSDDGAAGAAGGSSNGGARSNAAQGRPRRVSWDDMAPQQAQHVQQQQQQQQQGQQVGQQPGEDGGLETLSTGSPFSSARPAEHEDELDLEAQQAQQAQQRRAQRHVGWQE